MRDVVKLDDYVVIDTETTGRRFHKLQNEKGR